MEYQWIQCSVNEMIATVTINRPSQLNALSTAVLTEMQQVFADLKTQEIRAVILTGAGEKSFVAGADVAEMIDMDQRAARQFSEYGNQVMRQIELFPAPVIAAVNGYAFGGGFELALACDLILASDNALFAFPEVTLGVTPGFGGTQRLARLIGIGRAKDLLLTARRISAAEALQLGIVLQVIEKSLFAEQVLAYARSIAKNAPIAVASVKRSVNRGIACDLDTAIAIEAEIFSGCFSSEDQKSAMNAFLQKRKPEPFTNR
jgi:enoyl-CoA hydratase